MAPAPTAPRASTRTHSRSSAVWTARRARLPTPRDCPRALPAWPVGTAGGDRPRVRFAVRGHTKPRMDSPTVHPAPVVPSSMAPAQPYVPYVRWALRRRALAVGPARPVLLAAFHRPRAKCSARLAKADAHPSSGEAGRVAPVGLGGLRSGMRAMAPPPVQRARLATMRRCRKPQPASLAGSACTRTRRACQRAPTARQVKAALLVLPR